MDFKKFIIKEKEELWIFKTTKTYELVITDSWWIEDVQHTDTTIWITLYQYLVETYKYLLFLDTVNSEKMALV